MLTAGCAELDGAEDAPAEISHVLEGQSPLESGVAPTQARVQEDGLFYPLKVVVRGQRNATVRVAAWSDDNRLLGEASVVAPYDNTEWKRLNLFMPYSSVHRGGESINGTAYVLAPDNSRKFLASVGVGVTAIAPRRLIWEFREFEEDIDLGGERGIRLRLTLHRFGYTDAEHRVVLVVRDANREEFPPSLGGPIRVNSARLQGSSVASHLTWSLDDLDLPYSAIRSLGDGRAITVTPAVRMSDGTLRLGNLHIEFLAGGGPEKIAGRMREEIRRTNSRIQLLERELGILQGN